MCLENSFYSNSCILLLSDGVSLVLFVYATHTTNLANSAVVGATIVGHGAVGVRVPTGDASAADTTRDLDETCVAKFLTPTVLDLPVRPVLSIFAVANDSHRVVDLLANAAVHTHCLRYKTIVWATTPASLRAVARKHLVCPIVSQTEHSAVDSDPNRAIVSNKRRHLVLSDSASHARPVATAARNHF